MNYLKKTILNTLFILLIPVAVFSQDDKTVTLTVSAQGETLSDAKQNALRDAIEQAFGTFISSNTEILNDQLVKDEIVSVSNGNIQDYEVISEVQLPDSSFATTLKATVSVTKLTSFVESKGVEAELKGSLFAYNIKQQKLNEENEIKALKSIVTLTLKLLRGSFYGEITPKEPYLKERELYTLPYVIEIFATDKTNAAVNYFMKNLKQISMTAEEKGDYLKLKKEVYHILLYYPRKPINGEFEYNKIRWNSNIVGAKPIDLDNDIYEFEMLYLRNKKSIVEYLVPLITNSMANLLNFGILVNSNKANSKFINISEIDEYIYNPSYGDKKAKSNGLVPFYTQSKHVNYLMNQLVLNQLKTFSSTNNNEYWPINMIYPYPKREDECCFGFSRGNIFQGDSGPHTINTASTNYFENKNDEYPRYDGPLVFDLLLNLYQKDGLVYRLHGKTHLTLEELSKISTLKIKY